ncbi:hypothetical protein GGI21_006687 [Coemansia aciculifera]|nr:hypothetical protein GGI21_006687 [Coemansia aciculifera]
MDNLLAFRRSLHDVTNRRFRCWRIGNAEDYSVKEVLVCVLAVAMICPNFVHIALPFYDHSELMAMLEEVIKSGEFVQIESQLQRLLFIRDRY